MDIKKRLKAALGLSVNKEQMSSNRQRYEVLMLNIDSSTLAFMHKPAFTWILQHTDCKICTTSGLHRNAFWVDLIDENFVIFTGLEWDIPIEMIKVQMDALNKIKPFLSRIIYIMAPDAEHVTVLQNAGYNAFVCNKNCWIDENIFKPIKTEKLYDAILNAIPAPFKRHHLASKVNRLALLSRLPWTNFDCGPILSGLNWIYRNESSLPPEDVAATINKAQVGLCLSEIEGACFSSTEYLSCGVPVVSTHCSGGREFWYNEYNSVVCEPNADSVAEAVRFLKNNPRDPERIRRECVEIIRMQRRNFVDIVNSICNNRNIQFNCQEFLDNHFANRFLFQNSSLEEIRSKVKIG